MFWIAVIVMLTVLGTQLLRLESFRPLQNYAYIGGGLAAAAGGAFWVLGRQVC